jgi:hypothetical protein
LQKMGNRLRNGRRELFGTWEKRIEVIEKIRM